MRVEAGKQKLNSINLPNKKEVMIVPFGDNHYGSKDFDEKLFRFHMDWVLKRKNTYCLFIGDQIECSTRTSVGAGVYEQDRVIHEQIEGWVDMVSPLAKKGKILGIHTGNHEDRIWKDSGIDVAKLMAKMLGVPYFGWTILHHLRLKNQSYVLYSTHGSSGARLPHTKIKACIDRSNQAEADVYIMGHLHALDHHIRECYVVDRRSKRVLNREKHFVLCGSYLNHWDSYGEHAGYEILKKGSPKIKLDGKDYRISVTL